MVPPLETPVLAKDMTLRDAAALAALTGLLAGQCRHSGQYNLGELPTEALRIADAFLIERERGERKDNE